jgi:hypothetical protein
MKPGSLTVGSRQAVSITRIPAVCGAHEQHRQLGANWPARHHHKLPRQTQQTAPGAGRAATHGSHSTGVARVQKPSSFGSGSVARGETNPMQNTLSDRPLRKARNSAF